jgi:hypothetical protein
MSKPAHSVVDEPRPVPNSTRALGEMIERGNALGDPRRMVHLGGDVGDRGADVESASSSPRRR